MQIVKNVANEQKRGNFTCLREIGKVIRLHCSGVLTTSLVTSRHDRQTAAQANTCLLAGHKTSLASTLCMTSRSNSGGRLAHLPCCSSSSCCWCKSWGHGCRGPPRRFPTALPSDVPPPLPLLDMLPIPSLISFSSRTMLLKDISTSLSSLRDPTVVSLQDLESWQSCPDLWKETSSFAFEQ